MALRLAPYDHARAILILIKVGPPIESNTMIPLLLRVGF